MMKHHDDHHESDIEKWKQRAEENLNGWKRAKADYLNLKRDSEKQMEDIAAIANIGLILSLLPIADHFRTALAHIPDDQKNSDWVKGVVSIKKELDQLFDRLELKAVPTETFDPKHHEAVTREKADGKKEGDILDILEIGYTLHGKLIRPAKVKVAE